MQGGCPAKKKKNIYIYIYYVLIKGLIIHFRAKISKIEVLALMRKKSCSLSPSIKCFGLRPCLHMSVYTSKYMNYAIF